MAFSLNKSEIERSASVNQNRSKDSLLSEEENVKKQKTYDE